MIIKSYPPLSPSDQAEVDQFLAEGEKKYALIKDLVFEGQADVSGYFESDFDEDEDGD